jgi:plastocyanin
VDRLDPPTAQTEYVAPPGPSAVRSRVRRGALGFIAATAVVASVLALSGLSSTPATTTEATAPAPAVSLAAVQRSSAQALSSLTGLTGAAAPNNAAAPAASSSDAVSVTIQNYAFSPASLTIAVGATVVWTNEDTAPHTVTVSDGPVKFSSPNLQKGDTFTYTFTTAGAYHYYCAVHPDMKASVTVTGSGTVATTTTAAPPATTTGMSMPTTTTASSGGAGACLISGVLTPLIQHINSAHLGESPGQQLQDILNLNQYILTHTVLIENMLNPLTDGGLMTVLNGVLTPFIQHVDAAHLGESPGQQVQDILNLNQYVQTHTVLIENMMKPLEAASC